jgi:hypothetical protein
LDDSHLISALFNRLQSQFNAVLFQFCAAARFLWLTMSLYWVGSLLPMIKSAAPAGDAFRMLRHGGYESETQILAKQKT